VSVLVEIVVVTLVMYLATPPAGQGRTAEDLGIDLGAGPGPTHGSAPTREGPGPQRGGADGHVANHVGADPRVRPTPGQWLEHSPILSWLVVLLGGAYLARY